MVSSGKAIVELNRVWIYCSDEDVADEEFGYRDWVSLQNNPWIVSVESKLEIVFGNLWVGNRGRKDLSALLEDAVIEEFETDRRNDDES